MLCSIVILEVSFRRYIWPSTLVLALLLAEAYEKKGDKAEALKYYKEYLQVFPTAPDAKNVRKKIEKLSGQ